MGEGVCTHRHMNEHRPTPAGRPCLRKVLVHPVEGGLLDAVLAGSHHHQVHHLLEPLQHLERAYGPGEEGLGVALPMIAVTRTNEGATLLNSQQAPSRCDPPLLPAYPSTSLHTIESSKAAATPPRTRHGLDPRRKVAAFEESVDGLVTLLLAYFPDFRKVVKKVV